MNPYRSGTGGSGGTWLVVTLLMCGVALIGVLAKWAWAAVWVTPFTCTSGCCNVWHSTDSPSAK